ncbi:alpha/beta hydrolase [Segniliparus rotundus]|uniref:alpha/beta hydrolase n=1 Tax=Segniliparus rotundus TaxID=286802 RepID=UPI001FDF7490|nr:alpha/beta hydrolase [Segniliparus rotundus]
MRSVDVAALGDLATSLASRASSLEEARAQFAKITQFPGWSGTAKDAAAGSFQRADASLLDDVARVSAVHQAVLELSADFAQLQARVRELEREAASIGAVLGDDGKVTFPEGAPWPDATQQHRALVIGGEAYELMTDADRLDEKAGEVLRKAVGGEINAAGTGNETQAALAGAAQGTLGMPEPPKAPGGHADPSYNAGWWKDLTPEQRRRVLDLHPEWVGNLDGVPASVHDEANRKMLPGDIARLQAEVDRLQKQLDSEFGHGAFSNTDSDLWYAQRRLEGLQATEKALRDNPGTKLLVLDPDYGTRGRVAIGTGDPDTANHISISTPGVNSSPGQSIGEMTKEAVALKTETENVLKANGHGNETVSTISWIGYEPPQAQLDPQHLDKTGDVGPGGLRDEPGGLSDVASDAKAKAGAASLSQFYEGISAAWHPADGDSATSPHITALGHSYGSLTTSLALQQTQTGVVDNAVFYGSPGLELPSLDRLPVATGHAYSMQAPSDPINYVPNLTEHYGPNPVEIPGITRLSTEAGDTTGDAAPGTTVHHDGAHGHSEYPRKGDNGQLRMPGYNMSVIVAGMTGQDGRPDLTKRGE